MHQKGVNKFTRLQYDSSYSGQQPLYRDSTSETGYPSIAQFIRKAFLISDNDAYNRMYEFVGQREINRRLFEMGYTDMRIVRQFMPLTEEENRHTNQVRFLDSSGKYDLSATTWRLTRTHFNSLFLPESGKPGWIPGTA